MKFIKDYDCGIHYHPGKANVVANAVSRKVPRMRKKACEEPSDKNKAILASIQINSTIVD